MLCHPEPFGKCCNTEPLCFPDTLVPEEPWDSGLKTNPSLLSTYNLAKHFFLVQLDQTRGQDTHTYIYIFTTDSSSKNVFKLVNLGPEQSSLLLLLLLKSAANNVLNIQFF